MFNALFGLFAARNPDGFKFQSLTYRSAAGVIAQAPSQCAPRNAKLGLFGNSDACGLIGTMPSLARLFDSQWDFIGESYHGDR